MDEELVRNLTKGNVEKRRSASYKMGKTKNPVYVPLLIEAYNDADWAVNINIVNSLKQIASPEATDFLKTIPKTSSRQTNPSQALVSEEITYSPSRVNNYKAIKSLSGLFKLGSILAGMTGALSFLSAFGSLFLDSSGAELYIFGFFFILTISLALTFAFISESINIILDIEANSRQAAKTLERILRGQISE